MQDRYAGDIGDYGKFGFLRALEQNGLFVGVNWYFTYPDDKEKHQEDGRYRIAQKYFPCDQKLATTLYEISTRSSDRTVEALERASLLKSALYYQKPVLIKEQRSDWHQEALRTLHAAEIVFLDPDNGLLVKSVGANSKRAGKYVFDCELRDYIERGQAVTFYQHRPRKKPELYFMEMEARIKSVCEGINPQIMTLTFPKCSVRDYFIVCPAGSFAEQITSAKQVMLKGQWGQLGVAR